MEPARAPTKLFGMTQVPNDPRDPPPPFATRVPANHGRLSVRPHILAAGALEALPERFDLHLRQAGMRVAVAQDPTALFAR